jgi:hypothetical protein
VDANAGGSCHEKKADGQVVRRKGVFL